MLVLKKLQKKSWEEGCHGLDVPVPKNHFYMLITLYLYLLTYILGKGIYYIGTVRSNQKRFPQGLVPLASMAKIGSFKVCNFVQSATCIYTVTGSQ